MKNQDFGNNLSRLMKLRSWKLERISSTTFPPDITTKLSRMTPKELESIAAMIRKGECYRCRIGTRRYHFGSTPTEAIGLALENFIVGE